MIVYTALTDNELVLLLKESDRRAMTEVYDRFWDKLLAVAVNRLAIETEAEECVQDVFLSLWKRRENLELRHSLSTYLWIAVKYQVINRLDKRYKKHQIKTTELSEEDTLVSTPSPEAYLLEKELMARIEATVQQLPEKCRIVYRLSREDGKTHKEISEELGISEKTVEGHVTRALKDIRTNLTAVAPLFLICHLLNDIHHKL